MKQEKKVATAKVLAIVGFLVLLTTTYLQRHEILTLTHMRYSADNLEAQHNLKRSTETYPERVEEHKVEVKDYEFRMKHYQEMLNLYQTNYDEYVKRLKGKYRPPELPTRPSKPESPKARDEVVKAEAEFVAQKHRYFASVRRVNWIAWFGAVLFLAGILYLLWFDEGGKKMYYFLVLVLTFVFMIGPSFHSIMSLIAGYLGS